MRAIVVLVLAAAVFFWISQREAPKDRIVLLPEADGKPSALIIKSARGNAMLDRPYAAANVGGKGSITLKDSSDKEVSKRYSELLAAIPARPVSWQVYFVKGSDELTPESSAVLDQVKAELTRRPAPEISVIGHTDSVHTMQANDALSLKRAEVVKNVLVRAGFDAQKIEVSGRGERELLIPTPDEVDEPRNRRVEISVR